MGLKFGNEYAEINQVNLLKVHLVNLIEPK